LREAARVILDVGGAKVTDSISLTQIRESNAALRSAGVRDGIVAPETLTDTAVADTARVILSCLAGATNRAGKIGVDAATIAAFRAARTRGLAHVDAREKTLVWGDASRARATTIREVAPSIEEFFLQCRLVAVQPDAAESLRLSGDRVTGSMGDHEALLRAARSLPIAPANPKGELRWSELYRGAAYETIERFRREAVTPTLGDRPVLTEGEFRDLDAKARAIVEWYAEVERDKVVALGDKLRDIADAHLDALEARCKADLAERPRLESIDELEKLVLYQRWLVPFANNFVAMPDLYSASKSALFKKGELVLAGRVFTLAVYVPDRAAHIALAEQSTTFVAYVKVDAPDASYEVAVPVTSGTAAGVYVGKRGVFRDTSGKEFDAQVVHVVRHPVSLWEAATSPFARVSRFVSERLQNFGESGDRAMEQQIRSAQQHEPPRDNAAGAGQMAGIVAAGGIALAAVGTAFAMIATFLRTTPLVDVLRFALAIALLIMIPSGFLGWLKLRRRDMAIVLEGSGWALNDRLKLTRRLGRLFTRRPPRPRGSRVSRLDLIPVVERDPDASRWAPVVTVATVVVIATAGWVFRDYVAQGVRILLPHSAPGVRPTRAGAAGR
jgi:hypothetical protein